MNDVACGPPSIHVGPAALADVDAVLALERATENAPHWPVGAYRAILETGDEALTATARCLFVARDVSGVVGFAVGALPVASQDRTGELESVAVAITARRLGIGRRLCEAVIVWCRQQGAAAMTLEVRAHSAAAIALYASLGFVAAGRRPRYYRDPEDDAAIMTLELGECAADKAALRPDGSPAKLEGDGELAEPG